MQHSYLGILVVLTAVTLAALSLSMLPLRRKLRLLVLAGLVLRVIGALGYLFVVGEMYGGGDYLLYFRAGSELAGSAFTGGPGSIWDSAIWTEGRWWGTSFTVRITALLLLLIGPTLAGAFITFSVASYVGIVALGLAFHRAYPQIPVERYFVWIALFPALWFWPAALGKEAIVLCGVGIATLGFVGKHNRTRWLLLAVGIFLVFAIRPHVAAVLVVAMVVAHWIASLRRMSVVRVAQGVLLVAVAVSVLALSGGALGIDMFQPEEVDEYLEGRGQASAIGGSAIDHEQPSRWLAPVNTLFRPFIWEAQGIMPLLAALEVLAIWGIAWYKRRSIKAFIRHHRKTKLFWLAVVFVLLYAVALGMSISNMGIIARLRVHILPFIFMFFALPRPRRRKRVRLRHPQPQMGVPA